MKTRLITILAVVAAMLFLATQATAGPATLWLNTQSDWSSPSHLYSYSVSGGETTDRGTLGGLPLVTDITFGQGGQMYGIAFPNASGSGSGRLYAISPGSSSSVASYTTLDVNGRLSGSINGLAYFEGALYVSSYDTSFYKLTPEDNGSWTVAKSGKLKNSSSGDLAFAADGTLYVTVENGSGSKLATVNYNTASKDFGKEHFVGAKTGFDEVYGLAFANGQLYGAAGNGGFSNSSLVTFDLASGTATSVADLGRPVWGMTGVDAIAEVLCSSPPNVPEPVTLGLLAAGFGLMQLKRLRRHV